MKLGIVTATVGYWAGVQRLVESFYKFSEFENEFFIVPNLHKERSVSAAWNFGISQALDAGCEYIIVANDDSYVANEEAIPAMLRHMWDNNLWIVRTYYRASDEYLKGFHFFLIHKDIVDKVGYFDETFWPAYFEDDDYHYRCMLIDPSKTDKILVNVPHEKSVTLKSMSKEEREEMYKLMEENEVRYSNKWGGPPDHERWTMPYEGFKEPERYIGLSLEGLVDFDITNDR